MVAEKYDLVSKMSFNSNVERCEWIESRSRWRLYVRDSTTNRIFIHESQFLFGASGGLVTPNELDVPGIESFKGQVFHSGRWRHDVSLEGKDVVIFGNGCTAAQVVPNIVKKTGHLTQIVRSKHWIMPSIDYEQSPASKVLMKWIPGLMALQRFFVFCVAENEFRAFPMTRAAAAFRERKRKLADKYMRETAPKKYHDILIPEFEISCKRRIFDSGYLKSLHEPNLTLTNSPALEIVPEGVRTKDGTIKADVIILANGFKTNYFVGGVDIIGRNGETFAEHWSSFGGPEAYNTCALSGFPNFFMLLGMSLQSSSHRQRMASLTRHILGPNSATGHTSAIMAAENSINYALRIIKPVLDGKATVTEVKLEAEKKYSDKIQNDLRKTVWFSGCQSWYIKSDAKKPGQKWNAMSYPYSQAHFWYRSLFPVWSDWKIYVRHLTIIVLLGC
jgi:cation diffusion facilitator CzcD-associated flavoprotein CzcO